MTNYIERYWRDATPEDAIKEPPMVARFRDNWESDEDWVICKLIYWDRSETPWNSETCDRCERCQVYDAPDPGAGWRLIDVDTETPKEDDQYLCPISNVWCFWVNYSKDSIVRRRIEQPKPEPRYEPFRWEDREQLREKWIGSNDGRWEIFIAFIYKDSEGFYANDISTESLLKGYHFLDTGEPVGRRVE